MTTTSFTQTGILVVHLVDPMLSELSLSIRAVCVLIKIMSQKRQLLIWACIKLQGWEFTVLSSRVQKSQSAAAASGEKDHKRSGNPSGRERPQSGWSHPL